MESQEGLLAVVLNIYDLTSFIRSKYKSKVQKKAA